MVVMVVVLMCIAVSLGEVRETLVTYKRGVVFIRVAGNHEVGFIVKPTIAFATKSKFVLIPFRSSKRANLFITGVELVAANSNKTGGSSPVVSSSSSCRHFVRCLCQVTIICLKEEKAFQFYPTVSENGRSSKKKSGGVTCQKHTELVFCFFVVMVITGHMYSVTQESSNA